MPLLLRTRVHKGWWLAGILVAMIVGANEAPRAIVVGNLGLFGVTCPQCDTPISENAVLGAPLQTVIGATWVAAPNGSLYAGGIRAGQTVRFHLPLQSINAQLGTTHFLVLFTTVVEGNQPGLLHVRDTSPGAKGDIKMIAGPAAPGGDTGGLLQRVYRTPGADNVLQGDGSNTSSDPLPWDHPINNPVIDFALHMSGLEETATWGLTTVIVGLHKMPCQCEPGAPQNLAKGCVPQNATDITFSQLPPNFAPPQVYCPDASSPFARNACGKPQAKAWSCAQVLDSPPRDLPFTCTVTAATTKGDAVYTCSSEPVAAHNIPASSCTYTAKICP